VNRGASDMREQMGSIVRATCTQCRRWQHDTQTNALPRDWDIFNRTPNQQEHVFTSPHGCRWNLAGQNSSGVAEKSPSRARLSKGRGHFAEISCRSARNRRCARRNIRAARGFAAGGASVEHRNSWYITDIDDNLDDDTVPVTSFAAAMKKILLQSENPSATEEDLIVSVRLTIEARAVDIAAASVYWAALALSGN